jgi:hypothetical protein
MRRVARLAGLLLLSVAGACTGGTTIDPFAELPEPDGVDIAETTTTTEADFSGVPLAPAMGTTSTSVGIGPGPLTIVGRVEGPDGVVSGAVVHLERLVGDGSATAQVPTAADGTWNLANVLGGRYRVRAWRAPDLAMARPSIVFLQSGKEPRAVDLRLEEVGGVRIDVAVAPDPPVVDEPANVKVRVAERTVDDDGVVRDAPSGGVSVTISGSGDWAISSPNPSTTSTDGTVTFRMTCGSEGAQPLFATVAGDESYALAIQPCVERGSTATSSTSTSTSTSSTSSSSTSSTTTTTTTEP